MIHCSTTLERNVEKMAIVYVPGPMLEGLYICLH